MDNESEDKAEEKTEDAPAPRRMSHQIMVFFKYDHLPEVLQRISKPFGVLADQIDQKLPKNAESATALRKLLEAKDCAVRAFLSMPVEKVQEPEQKETATD